MGTMLIIGMGGKPPKGNKRMNPMESYMNDPEEGSDKEHLVESEDDSMKSGKITFSKPAGFKVPDGTKDGETFDAMATIKLEGGKLVLEELDGTPVDDEHEGEEESEESEEGEEMSEPAEEESEQPEGEEEGGMPDFLSAVERKASKAK